MLGQRGLVAAVVATLLGGSGCVCCGSKGFGVAHDAGPDCDTHTCQRNKVYVFAVGGLNPAGILALDSFREKLNERGFAKVASGQSVHALWMADEMRRTHKDDPDAVFVVIGSEAGGPVAVRLARQAATDGLPVAALVLLDAEGRTPAPVSGVRTLLVGGFGETVMGSGAESVPVPGVGRFALPTDPRAVEAVVGLLNSTAAATTVPPAQEVWEWDYPHAAPLRPLVEPGANPEWAFLFDQSGGVPQAIPSPATASVAKPTVATQPTASRQP